MKKILTIITLIMTLSGCGSDNVQVSITYTVDENVSVPFDITETLSTDGVDEICQITYINQMTKEEETQSVDFTTLKNINKLREKAQKEL